MLSVIRIALKWLIGLLCGYVITTTGVRQAYHIRHQSEGCIMIYRLFLVKVLHSHNDNNKWDFFFGLVSTRMVCPDTCIKSAASTYFSVVYFTGTPQPFQHMHDFKWVFSENSCGVATF